MTIDYVMQRLAQTETRMRKEMGNSHEKWEAWQKDNTEQIDWMCEQIKSLTERMDITIRRLDELFPDRINHHLRLLKLEEAKENPGFLASYQKDCMTMSIQEACKAHFARVKKYEDEHGKLWVNKEEAHE